MAKVKGKDTKPEMAVRSLLHKMGFRFRLHRKDLPGKPDIVLPKYRTILFIHGCFWHQHPGCRKATIPENNIVFWRSKLYGNVERDHRTEQTLERLGWHVIIIWECEIKSQSPQELSERLSRQISCNETSHKD